MKNIIDICNVNISNSLHSLYESSLLGDIEDTLEYGDTIKEDMYKFQWEYACT